MGETDVDGYFYHNIFDISQSQLQNVRLSNDFNKKFFALKLFQLCDLKTNQRNIFQEFQELPVFGTTVCAISSKLLITLAKCIQIPLPKTKFEIGSTKSKDNLFAHYYNEVIERTNRQIRLPFRFGITNFCVFSIKAFELHGNQLILTEIVNLNHREFHHIYKNRYYVANKCEIIESNYDV